MVPATKPPFSLVRLEASHPVADFTCGTRPGAAEIDEYLKAHALTEQAQGLSSVWLAVENDGQGMTSPIAGYFSLSPLSIRLSDSLLESVGLSDVQYRTVEGYLLGRLGVAAHQQGKGLGAVLIAAAIKIARQVLRYEAGGAFLAVDPKSAKLLAWYEGLDFGFRRLDPTRPRLVLRL
jgi:GNAT superfamily N-acetyltransferase